MEVIEAIEMHSRQRSSEFYQFERWEEEFIRRAKIIRRFGAAVIAMAFDEDGQADTLAEESKFPADLTRF